MRDPRPQRCGPFIRHRRRLHHCVLRRPARDLPQYRRSGRDRKGCGRLLDLGSLAPSRGLSPPPGSVRRGAKDSSSHLRAASYATAPSWPGSTTSPPSLAPAGPHPLSRTARPWKWMGTPERSISSQRPPNDDLEETPPALIYRDRGSPKRPPARKRRENNILHPENV